MTMYLYLPRRTTWLKPVSNFLRKLCFKSFLIGNYHANCGSRSAHGKPIACYDYCCLWLSHYSVIMDQQLLNTPPYTLLSIRRFVPRRLGSPVLSDHDGHVRKDWENSLHILGFAIERRLCAIHAQTMWNLCSSSLISFIFRKMKKMISVLHSDIRLVAFPRKNPFIFITPPTSGYFVQKWRHGKPIHRLSRTTQWRFQETLPLMHLA